tara:strand:- start:212 stop:853 length:642 start_codon:yes stop_codon:yes gene_type:complete
MTIILPSKLSEAEDSFTTIILNQLDTITTNRLAINLKFEGLRLMPIASRLARNLLQNKVNFLLLWSDAGSVALAKRDNPDLNSYIYSYSDIISGKFRPSDNEILIAVNPEPYDYEIFNRLCESYSDRILMINGRLEDTAIGIGSIGRDRKRVFINSWHYIYYLEPMNNGAIMMSYPNEWTLFSLSSDGYRYLTQFPKKPTLDLIVETFLSNQN